MKKDYLTIILKFNYCPIIQDLVTGYLLHAGLPALNPRPEAAAHYSFLHISFLLSPTSAVGITSFLPPQLPQPPLHISVAQHKTLRGAM